MLYILNPCPVRGSLIAYLGPAMHKQSGSLELDLGLIGPNGHAKPRAKMSQQQPSIRLRAT